MKYSSIRPLHFRLESKFEKRDTCHINATTLAGPDCGNPLLSLKVRLFSKHLDHKIGPVSYDTGNASFDVLSHQFRIVHRPRLDLDIFGVCLADEAFRHDGNIHRLSWVTGRLDGLVSGGDESAQEDLAQ